MASGILRFNPDIGLAELPPMTGVTGNPTQKSHTYFEDKAHGFDVGVWDCTPYTWGPAPYPVHEFMVMLSGSVTIVDGAGAETVVRAGESFILPKGLVCQWRQTEHVRKFYVIWDDTSGMPAEPGLQVLKLDPKSVLPRADGPDLSLVVGGRPPVWHDRQAFADPTGQWLAGVWDSTPYERKPIVFPRHELMHIIEGAVTITDGDGRDELFRAGETFFVPMGATMSWKSTQDVRKIYCIFKPAG